jgi:hypothetical protein
MSLKAIYEFIELVALGLTDNERWRFQHRAVIDSGDTWPWISD